MEQTAITDDMVVQRARAAVQIALEKNKALGVPSIVYDRKTQKIYELRSDGTRVPVAERAWKIICSDLTFVNRGFTCRIEVESISGITAYKRRPP